MDKEEGFHPKYCKCPKCGGEKAVKEIISKVIVCTECGYRGM